MKNIKNSLGFSIKTILVKKCSTHLHDLLDHLELYENIEIIKTFTDSDQTRKESSLITSISELNPDLLFLDLEMSSEGFDLYRGLSEPKPMVIFCSSSPEKYALEAYQFSPIHFFKRPYNSRDVKVALERATQQILERREQQKNIERYIFLDCFNEYGEASIKNFSLKRLQTIEVSENKDRHLHFHTTDQQVVKSKKKKSLKEAYREYGPLGFEYCYHNLLVNVRQIREICDDHTVFLNGGREIRVSKRKLKPLREALKAVQ